MVLNILKVLFSLFILLFIWFYYWGSSTNLDQNQYHIISELQIPQNVNDSTDIKILSYNIGYLSGMINNLPIKREKSFFDTNLNTAIKMIESVNPQIIAFQEIDYDADRSYNQNQLLAIAEKLSYKYSSKSINWDMKYVPFPYYPFSMHFGKVISGQAVLSRYPITFLEAHKFEKPESNPFYYNQFYIDRLLQINKINIGTQELVVINVHLEAFKAQDRQKQILEMITQIQPYTDKYPTIILGDFNNTLLGTKESSLDLMLNQLPLKEASQDSLGNFIQTIGTYSTENPENKIDHIFYTYNFIEKKDWGIIKEQTEASDHLPIYMTFKIKNLAQK